MKTRKLWMIVSVAAALAVSAAAQKSPEVAMRAAMETETIKGDLKGAIEQYKKVAQSGNRGLAAQALVRMAECYQKLGDSESRNIYARVVRRHPCDRCAGDVRVQREPPGERATGLG